MKRFYKAVSVEEAPGGWQIALDERRVKTAAGAAQIVPTKALGEAMAREWAEQGETMDPARFVLRDMADYALDVVASDRGAAIEKLLGYGETDTLLYRADPSDALFARQEEVWEPIIAAFEAREGLSLTRISGVIHQAQDARVAKAYRARLEAFDAFALAGIEAMTSLAASLLIGLAASEAEDDVRALALWQAASLEEEWQAALWGRDEEAEERRQKREADFLAAFEATRLALAKT